MPKASRFPRKYKSQIEEAHDQMMRVIKCTRDGISALKTNNRSAHEMLVRLYEVQTVTLEATRLLQEIEFAADCGECPLAPPLTSAHSMLVATASQLEQIADTARRHALGEDGRTSNSRE